MPDEMTSRAKLQSLFLDSIFVPITGTTPKLVMTEIHLALPLTPIEPHKSPRLYLKVADFNSSLQVGQTIEIRNGQLASSIGMFIVMIISCHQGYVIARPESSSVSNKAIEVYQSLHRGKYRLLNLEEYESLYPLPEGF